MQLAISMARSRDNNARGHEKARGHEMAVTQHNLHLVMVLWAP